MGLINGLFPAVDGPRGRNLNEEDIVRQRALSARFEAEDQFVRKVLDR
jgi:hypothetical protein